LDIAEFKSARELGSPVVIRGALKDHEFVKSFQCGNVHLMAAEELRRCPQRRYTVYIPGVDGYLNQAVRSPDASVSFDRFLNWPRENDVRYLLGLPDLKGKHGASPLERLPGETDIPVFAEKLSDDMPFYKLYPFDCVVRKNLFFNFGYSFTDLHFDTDSNFYLCASGKRRWSLAHPNQSRVLLAGKEHGNKSSVKPTVGDFSSIPLAALVRFVTIDLSPGDLLFVPSRWWHVVEGALGNELSCGVNWFFETEDETRLDNSVVSRISELSPAQVSACLESEVGKKLLHMADQQGSPFLRQHRKQIIAEATQQLSKLKPS
jgi:hypothetical protein